mmetsp:Transcript_449/g.902  ORF Transcript_449/g.902 Transcript_449/m.902 type:complete len:227 (+) Transcript_449:1407-2087(+)
MQLNKIKIENVEQWDVAKGKNFIAKPVTERNLHRSTLKMKTISSHHSVINEDVCISDYAFSKFRELRELDQITHQQIKESLSTTVNKEKVFKAGESEGKSGSFFFFSHDDKFIIKTMFQEELDIMIESLRQYHDYIEQNPSSLIARIYGVFQVEMEGIVPVNLLLMANTIQSLSPLNKIIKVFDLKGSWNNRIVHQGEKQTKKDRNLLSCKKQRQIKGQRGLLQFD